MQLRSAPINVYVKNSIESDTVMVPSWNVYSKDLSIVAPEPEIVEEKMSDRKKQKAAAFKALMKKDMLEYAMQMTLQVGSKTVSNALSGAVSVGGTCLQNPSSHTTSTSTARCATSTPNGAIERFVTGAQHFKDPNSVLGYLASIKMTLLNNDVSKKYEEVMSRYNLVYPTVEDLKELVLSNTRDYWIDDEHMKLINKYIDKQSKLVIAAIYYNGSLFYLYKLNPELVKNWLTKLGKTHVGTPSDSDVEYLKGIGDILHNTLVHLFNPELKGVSKPLEELDPQLLADMAETMKRYVKTYEEFDGLFEVFFKPLILAPNVGDYKEMVRDAVIVNDTDSGLFHIGNWIEVLLGNAHVISDQSRRYCGVFAHLTNVVYTHAMDIMTINMNVHNPEKRNINMKSEFTFSLLALPSASKHYYGDITIIEGNVLEESRLEQKGVGLRSAATPLLVKTIAKDMQRSIPKDIAESGGIDVYKYLDLVVQVEEVIAQGALTNADYYQTIDIKAEDAKNVIWSHLWNDTKIGRDNKVSIPCELIKIPTILTTKSATIAWLDSITDEEVAEGVRNWLKENNKIVMPRLYLPKEKIVGHGIPVYMKPIISTKEVVVGTARMLYIVLETLGVIKDSKRTLSEVYTPGEKYPFLK